MIDGDTIRVRTLESTRRPAYLVDLIGIDAPETRRDDVVVECGGPEATHSALSLSFSGRGTRTATASLIDGAAGGVGSCSRPIPPRAYSTSTDSWHT